MSRVTCRCGEKLKVRVDDPDRINCPKCGARIRLRRATAAPQQTGEADDGYLRFFCPCGRRLKVSAQDRPTAGKCPDCGRVVPVPVSARTTGTPPKRSAVSDPEARTEEMDSNELARLERWAARHSSRSFGTHGGAPSTPAFVPIVPSTDPSAPADLPSAFPPPSVVKFEAGFRICPRCQKPVHLGASICRECGTSVPPR
jgi:hypothetical protein